MFPLYTPKNIMHTISNVILCPSRSHLWQYTISKNKTNFLNLNTKYHSLMFLITSFGYVILLFKYEFENCITSFDTIMAPTTICHLHDHPLGGHYLIRVRRYLFLKEDVHIEVCEGNIFAIFDQIVYCFLFKQP